jgi:hypothetical protein
LPVAATLRSFELAVVMLAVVDTPDAPGRCVTEPDGGGELGGSGRTSIVGMLPLRLDATAVGPDCLSLVDAIDCVSPVSGTY